MDTLSGFAPSFREFLGYLKVEAGLAPATLEAYGRDLRQLAQDLAPRGVTSPADVTMQKLAEHLQRLHREQGMEPTSIARHLVTIRVYFRYLHANRRVAADPSRLLERPTRWKRLPGVLSPNQMRALVQAPRGDGPIVTSFIFNVRNIPAALYKALGGFATNGVNMTKLESYMVGGAFAATQFLAEVDGHPDDPPVKRALEELRFFTTDVKILGVYPADPGRRA